MSDEIHLRRRADGATELRVNGSFVMDDVETSSERILAERVITLGARDVLVGGLGLGYTTRALLASSQVRRVVVAELHRAVVEAVAAGHGAGPFEDARLEIELGDVRDVVAAQPSTSLDAVLLDVDNGPDALVHESNAEIYRVGALTDAVRVLRPGGTLAIWSMADSPALREQLETVVGEVTTERVPVRLQGREESYWILAGTRPSAGMPPPPGHGTPPRQ
ncbi:hypothetical protein ACHAAC_09920 [Aeromicrobium sp. CF4.19]|uniref:hypothetical protein n=1 Tax=Aeromicrobium sp. CF4.19 TaxID=3373082 RepID=UPI003EE65D71